MSSAKEVIKKKLTKLKSELENINSRIQAASLLGDIKSLANEAAAFGLTLDLSGLEKSVEAKIQNLKEKEDFNSLKEQEEQNLKERRAQQLVQQREEIERKRTELKGLHVNWENSKNNFKESSKEVCSTLEKKGKQLDSALHEEYPELLNDKLDKLILPLEAIEQQHKAYKKVEESYKEVEERHKQLQQETKDIKTAIEKLEEQFKNKNLTPEEVEKLKTNIKDYKTALKDYISFTKEVDQDKKEMAKDFEKIKSVNEANEQKMKDLKKKIEAIKDPEKRVELEKKYEIFKIQAKAITSDGKVTNPEAHREVLSQIKTKEVASKIQNNQTQVVSSRLGNLCPTPTPNCNSKSNEKIR